MSQALILGKKQTSMRTNNLLFVHQANKCHGKQEFQIHDNEQWYGVRSNSI